MVIWPVDLESLRLIARSLILRMSWSWRGEEGFGTHDMDAALGVDELGDVDVAGYGDQSVGVVASHAGKSGVRLGEEDDHVANGHLGGGLEIFVEAHRDVLGRGFAAGPEEMLGVLTWLGLMHDELEGSG